MIKFSMDVVIESKEDRADTIVSGHATVSVDGVKTAITRGERLTAAEKRGGMTQAQVERVVASGLAALATKVAQG